MGRKTTEFDRITVHALGRNRWRGIVIAGNRQFPCALGRSGISATKQEGDGVTPAGRFETLFAYYRADREILRPSGLELLAISPDLGWCDGLNDRNYNRAVSLPYPGHHEKMWREDHLYDWCIVLDQNYSKTMRGRGSAIFLHLATPNFKPTEGCVAIQPFDMRWLIGHIGPRTKLEILNS